MILTIYDIENHELAEAVLIAQIVGVDNEACESQASDLYGDTDKYAWAYC